MSSTRTPSTVPEFGCSFNEDCTAGCGHDGACVFFERWHGMPDPHRHNPFAVAAVLAGLGLAWTVVAVVVVALIWGWRP